MWQEAVGMLERSLKTSPRVQKLALELQVFDISAMEQAALAYYHATVRHTPFCKCAVQCLRKSTGFQFRNVVLQVQLAASSTTSHAAAAALVEEWKKECD